MLCVPGDNYLVAKPNKIGISPNEKIDWKNLPLGYVKTDYNIRCIYKDGRWGKLEVSSSEYIATYRIALWARGI
jgi:hypothetical protein